MFKLVQLIHRDAQELAELDSICMGKYVGPSPLTPS